MEQLIAQRVYGLCLGYEDLNDYDALRHDPLGVTLWHARGRGIKETGVLRKIENDVTCCI